MNGQVNTFAERVLLFGPYAFHVRQRQVLRNGRAVPMGGRALDILQVLVERAGTVVSKEQIIEQVWPDSVVEAVNLRVHIAALRRALGGGRDGQRYIATVTHRGYSFVADVTQTPLIARHNLPASMTPLIGRDEAVAGLLRQFSIRRFVTLVGPAGVGKTRLACHVAEQLAAHYRDGVWWVDCSSGETLDVLGQALAGRHCLLLLDSAECLSQACRQLIEQLLETAPQLAVLATSRQPLYACGEWLQRVPGLALPSCAEVRNPAQGMACAAVQLWISRAQACQQDYVLREQDLSAVSDICRQLDGLPLAIELIAAQLEMFSVSGLQAQLGNRQWLLSLTRRTAVARHQSLAAALDWSHARLNEQQCNLLQRLAIFTQDFSLQAAARLVCDCDYAIDTLRQDLRCLEDTSLLLAIVSDGEARYQLFNTVRVHGLARLQASGEYLELQARYERSMRYRRELMFAS